MWISRAGLSEWAGRLRLRAFSSSANAPMRCAHDHGHETAFVGRVVAEHCGLVTACTGIGGTRVVDEPARELLPRIC